MQKNGCRETSKMGQKTRSQVCSQKGRVNDSKRVGVLRDKEGNLVLYAPEGCILTLQTPDFAKRLYIVTAKRVVE